MAAIIQAVLNYRLFESYVASVFWMSFDLDRSDGYSCLYLTSVVFFYSFILFNLLFSIKQFINHASLLDLFCTVTDFILHQLCLSCFYSSSLSEWSDDLLLSIRWPVNILFVLLTLGFFFKMSPLYNLQWSPFTKSLYSSSFYIIEWDCLELLWAIQHSELVCWLDYCAIQVTFIIKVMLLKLLLQQYYNSMYNVRIMNTELWKWISVFNVTLTGLKKFVWVAYQSCQTVSCFCFLYFFAAEPSCLDYNSETLKLFVGMDNGTISVSSSTAVYFCHKQSIDRNFLKLLHNCKS